MKKLLLCPLVFGAIALSFSSCATSDMIAKANGTPGPLDSPNQPPTNPNPAYYALVPVVLPFDIVAWPFQYLYLQSRTQYTGVQPPPPGYQGAPPAGAQRPPPGYPSAPPTGGYQGQPQYQQ